MVVAMLGGGWCGLNTKGCKGHVHFICWFGPTVVSYISTCVRALMKNFTVALKGKSCVM